MRESAESYEGKSQGKTKNLKSAKRLRRVVEIQRKESVYRAKWGNIEKVEDDSILLRSDRIHL